MKKLVIVIFFALISQSNFAQFFTKEKLLNNQNVDKKQFSYGYFLGLNNYGVNFEYKDGYDAPEIEIEKSIGFNVGLLANLRISEYLDLRFEPGLYITNRTLKYNSEQFEGYYYEDTSGNSISYNNYNFDTDSNSVLERELKSTYVHLPLLMKFSAKRFNNFKPFIVGGLSMSLNLNSNEKNNLDNHSGQFRMKKNTYYYEIGAGIDFYLEYFKFTPSIRGVFALSDELVKDNITNGASPWTDNIESMKTQGVFINFTFQ